MKSLESYKHLFAKSVLAEWFPEYSASIEVPFVYNGKILFIADVVLVQNNYICAIYEITHKHGLTGRKLGLIQYWFYVNQSETIVYDVNADYILNQVCPAPICGSELLFCERYLIF